MLNKMTYITWINQTYVKVDCPVYDYVREKCPYTT